LTRILIVEDDAAVAEALEMALEDEHEVAVARNGQEALARLAAQPVDVIVLDLMMPVMDGEELVQVLRKRGVRTPVIVASAGVDLRRRTVEMGAQDYLQKPYTLGDLLDKIARHGGGAGDPSGGEPGDSPSGAPPASGSDPDDDGSLAGWSWCWATPVVEPRLSAAPPS